MRTVSIALLFILLSLNLFANQKNKDENEKCFKCHSWSTLGYKDKETGLIVNLSVNPENYYSSNHKNLSCIECHSKEFSDFPHLKKLKEENLYCLDCHTDKKELSKYSFKEIEHDFKESIHYKTFGDKFTCFNCHEPHTFTVNARINVQISKTVLYDNHICLDCHNNSERIETFSNKAIPTLNTSHQWLPHLELHWANVRCIDCHATGTTSGVPHQIVSKDKAIRDCVNCHSENSILLQTLYKFRSLQKRNEEGFINATILNNSYVIGATRNYYLNLFSFIILGLTVISLGIHSYLRITSKKAKIKNDNE